MLWIFVSPQGAVPKDACPVLSDFSEGLLGKLQIRKSGKVELKLGDIVMDVTEGAAFSFLQVNPSVCPGIRGFHVAEREIRFVHLM